MKATEQYFPVVLFFYAVQGGSNCWVSGWNRKVWPFKWKLLSSTFLWCCFFMLYKVVLTVESVDEILKCDHSNKSYWPIESQGNRKFHILTCKVQPSFPSAWMSAGGLSALKSSETHLRQKALILEGAKKQRQHETTGGSEGFQSRHRLC